MKSWDLQKLNDKWETSVTLGEAGQSGSAEATKEIYSRSERGQWQSTKQHWVNTNKEYVSEQRLSRARVYQELLHFHSKQEKQELE